MNRAQGQEEGKGKRVIPYKGKRLPFYPYPFLGVEGEGGRGDNPPPSSLLPIPGTPGKGKQRITPITPLLHFLQCLQGWRRGKNGLTPFYPFPPFYPFGGNLRKGAVA
jgi:hypothetical protein